MEPIIDIAAATERMGGDLEILHEVMRIFLEESPRMLAAIAQAVAARDAKALELAAHCLKGSALMLAAGRLHEYTSALEMMGREARLDAAPDVWVELEDETLRLREELTAMLPAR